MDNSSNMHHLGQIQRQCTFIIEWDHLNFCAFSPVSVIPRALSKVKQDSAEGIIVVLLWPTQVWSPDMLTILYRLQFC